MTDFATALKALWPHGDQHMPGLLAGIIAAAPTVFPKYGITTPLLVAHAMAQFSEECGAGLELVENDNFTAEQLLRVFPTHFTASMAERYAHNPRMICDLAYGGRMGNAPPPSDDGYNYRGRGMSQVTGKDGYQALQTELNKGGAGIDVVATPSLVYDPRYVLLCGVADFVLCGCLPYAQKNDVVGVSAMLNDGHIVKPSQINGLASREQWLKRWVAAQPMVSVVAQPPALPTQQTAIAAQQTAAPAAVPERSVKDLFAELANVIDNLKSRISA